MIDPLTHAPLPDWPEEQAYISTRSGEKFLRFIDFIRYLPQKTRYPTMGIIIGEAGNGKTYSVRQYVATLRPRVHTGLPACVVLTLEKDTTKRYLVESLLVALREIPHGRSGFPLLDQATSAILRNDLELLIIDEADFLKEDTFELLRRIFDRTGCPVVVVGLPKLLQVVNLHEKFRSRMSMIHLFLPPGRAEILQTVLPRIVMPRWEYRLDNPADHAIGALAWDNIVPSFRNLRTVLQIASMVALERDAPRILKEHIIEALTLTTIPTEKGEYQFHELSDSPDTPEAISERRQAGKRRSSRKQAPRA